jgi:phage/plasmid-associated DNA primase
MIGDPELDFDMDAITSGVSKPPARRRNFILSYLFKCKEAYEAGERDEEGEYVQGLYNAWQRYAEHMGYKVGSANAFRQALYKLRNDGLIELYATGQASNPAFWPKSYYRIVVD